MLTKIHTKLFELSQEPHTFFALAAASFVLDIMIVYVVVKLLLLT